jgi:hypothetical protein
MKQFIEIAKHSRIIVAKRLEDLLSCDVGLYVSERDNEIKDCRLLLKAIDAALTVKADLEEGVRLVAATFLIALDDEEMRPDLDEVLANIVNLDIQGSCQAALITDAVEITDLVSQD